MHQNLFHICDLARNGFSAYLRYLFEVGKKMEVDKEPWLYPPDALSMCKIQALMTEMPRDQQTKNGIQTKRNVKRKGLTFSELTDIVVAAKIYTVEELWQEAKARKVAGDDLLWNRCGDDRNLPATLKRIVTAWHGDPVSALHRKCQYPLEAFTLPPECELWLGGKWKERALILSGGGGLGKTSLAASLLMFVAESFLFITRLDELRFLEIPPRCGLLWDEASMKCLDVDESKNLMDLEFTRTVRRAAFQSSLFLCVFQLR